MPGLDPGIHHLKTFWKTIGLPGRAGNDAAAVLVIARSAATTIQLFHAKQSGGAPRRPIGSQ
jgi:hypothetical protein